METELLTVDPEHPQAERIEQAARVLRAGGLVAFPTETVYGLGANALDAQALERIFVAKQRPRSDPIIAHIAETAQLRELAVDIPDTAWTLAEAFWPGPLTLILKRAPAVPGIIAEGRDTIAVRMPAHPVARALLIAAGVPVGAPSANTFTRPSATRASHVREDLNGRIAMILDGGATTIGLESTVLDLTGATPRILRPGGVTVEALRDVLPEVELAPSYVSLEQGSQSPGQLLKHYSPRARVLLFHGDDPARVRTAMLERARQESARKHRVGMLLSNEDAAALEARALESDLLVQPLGAADDLESIGRELFSNLRELDARGVDVILVRDPGRQGLGAALWDRLLRAAEGQLLEA